MIRADGTCDCCGRLVLRNKDTGEVYTKEEMDEKLGKNKKIIIKKTVEPKTINNT